MSDYIISFKDNVTPEQIEKFKKEVTDGGGEVGHTYDGLMSGFSAKIQPKTLQAFQANLADSPIESIEPDSKVTTQ